MASITMVMPEHTTNRLLEKAVKAEFTRIYISFYNSFTRSDNAGAYVWIWKLKQFLLMKLFKKSPACRRQVYHLLQPLDAGNKKEKMMKYVKLFALFLMIVFCSFCNAQNKTEPSKGNTKYETKDVITSHGPNNITRNIIQDRKGNIWIASFGGVFRYDRKSFTNVTSKVSSARFFSVLEDRKGNLWFGSIGSGVYYYDGKSFQISQQRTDLLIMRLLVFMKIKPAIFGSVLMEG